MPPPLTIAFLGCGFITGVHSNHLRALGPAMRLRYASRDLAKAQAFQRKFAGDRAYGSYQAALDDAAVDAVVIAVPPLYHLDLTLAALAAGKHVLVEKPAFPTGERFRDGAGRARPRRTRRHGRRKRSLQAAGRDPAPPARATATSARWCLPTSPPSRTGSRAPTTGATTRSMAGGDAFFEEGIHWLHVAGSLGPRIVSVRGYRPSVSRAGPDRRAKSMMVAFEYDNEAVGALYYSREVPSLFRGLRLSKLFGRRGVITFESNGLFVLTRGQGLPRLHLPGFRDIRGYQAMYRDFAAAIAAGRAPEMSVERALEDQRLMEQIYAGLAPAGPARPS